MECVETQLGIKKRLNLCLSENVSVCFLQFGMYPHHLSTAANKPELTKSNGECPSASS